MHGDRIPPGFLAQRDASQMVPICYSAQTSRDFCFLFLRSFLGVRVLVTPADIPVCTARPRGQPASLRKVLQSSENDECRFSGLLRRERQNTEELETT